MPRASTFIDPIHVRLVYTPPCNAYTVCRHQDVYNMMSSCAYDASVWPPVQRFRFESIARGPFRVTHLYSIARAGSLSLTPRVYTRTPHSSVGRGEWETRTGPIVSTWCCGTVTRQRLRDATTASSCIVAPHFGRRAHVRKAYSFDVWCIL